MIDHHLALVDMLRQLQEQIASRNALIRTLGQTLSDTPTREQTRSMNNAQRDLAEDYIAYGACLRRLIDVADTDAEGETSAK